MKTLFLILALAGSVNAMPGCTTGGAPLYLQIPTLGASGDQFSNCLAYDFAFISTATPIGINLGSTQTWTGANTFTSTSTLFTTPVYFGTYVYIGNTGFHATASANTTSNNFIDLNTKAGSGGGALYLRDNIEASTITAGDIYTAFFHGSGAYLTNVPAASIATGSLGSGVALSVSSTSINMAVSSAAATEIFTLTHGLGTVPTHQTVVLVCLVSTDGYTTGDEIDNFVHVGTIYKNSTAVTFYSGDGSQTGYLTVDGQNTWVNMKTRYSNWAVKIRAWK